MTALLTVALDAASLNDGFKQMMPEPAREVGTRERERERERERQTDRQTDRQRDREREQYRLQRIQGRRGLRLLCPPQNTFSALLVIQAQILLLFNV